mmetsp:Transcript_20451/g.36706  ORF Transcript_20451/g.36706 Transcript_20451/m.36706 type:complete len:95 (-) Transcript_20451:82-366(-)
MFKAPFELSAFASNSEPACSIALAAGCIRTECEIPVKRFGAEELLAHATTWCLQVATAASNKQIACHLRRLSRMARLAEAQLLSVPSPEEGPWA